MFRQLSLCSLSLSPLLSFPAFSSLFSLRFRRFRYFNRDVVAAAQPAMASDGEEDKKEKEKDRRKRLAVSPIAKPLAGKKLTKKTLKVVKKGLFLPPALTPFLS